MGFRDEVLWQKDKGFRDEVLWQKIWDLGMRCFGKRSEK